MKQKIEKIEKINETKSQFLEKVNKIDKFQLNAHYIYPVTWDVGLESITFLQNDSFLLGSMSIAEF